VPTKNADGEFNPTYRCLFAEPPPAGTGPSWQQAGILGALAGVLGSMTALDSFARSSDSARGWADAC
jgi:adenylyltransferase/sulfurtransferase